MDNYVVTLLYTNAANTQKTFRISGLTQAVTEAKALQALDQLPALGGFVDSDGDALYVNPVQATVTQTVKTIFKP